MTNDDSKHHVIKKTFDDPEDVAGTIKPRKGKLEAHAQIGFNVKATITKATATSSLDYALTSAGVDIEQMSEWMQQVKSIQLHAIKDKTLDPFELDVPMPSGYERKSYIDLAASYASSILIDRDAATEQQSRTWDRWVKVAAILAPFVGALIGYYVGVSD